MYSSAWIKSFLSLSLLGDIYGELLERGLQGRSYSSCEGLEWLGVRELDNSVMNAERATVPLQSAIPMQKSYSSR
ncbi:uncharacterized protein K444DRAFT_610127 [Hyaloscypha bicolor E]|uniref:Uncharacterized protein n=1 Tax=Hyaloscypha bicolor E TaxID=1095630 RepID=A0A2J6TJV2_9HELO|nr:uncharacterized protein K444DRAFT_610127 [Hyaloscypha bicolor E]PMD63294.1 hypothetical protein K444DRAFT_610127 [Hyaloscypha bicolor E]